MSRGSGVRPPVRPTAAGLALVDTWPEQVYQWHREGFELPRCGELLAEGDMFEVQAFRYRRSQIIRSLPKSAYARIQALFGKSTPASQQAS